jgi:hypothetical protein
VYIYLRRFYDLLEASGVADVCRAPIVSAAKEVVLQTAQAFFFFAFFFLEISSVLFLQPKGMSKAQMRKNKMNKVQRGERKWKGDEGSLPQASDLREGEQEEEEEEEEVQVRFHDSSVSQMDVHRTRRRKKEKKSQWKEKTNLAPSCMSTLSKWYLSLSFYLNEDEFLLVNLCFCVCFCLSATLRSKTCRRWKLLQRWVHPNQRS